MNKKNMINCIVYWGIRSSTFNGGRESKERRKKKKKEIYRKRKRDLRCQRYVGDEHFTILNGEIRTGLI